MRYPVQYYISFALHVALWGYILHRGRREGAFRRFRLFYTYVGVSFASLSAKMVAPYFIDRREWDYHVFYFATNVPILVLGTALLLHIYSMVRGGERWGHWLAIGAALTLCSWQAVLSPAADVYTGITSSVLFFQLALCTLIVFRLISNRAFTLGRNWEAIFIGISVPNVLHAVNSAAFLFEDWWPYPLYLRLIEPLSLLSWVIIAAGMRRLYPLQVTVRAGVAATGEVKSCSG